MENEVCFSMFHQRSYQPRIYKYFKGDFSNSSITQNDVTVRRATKKFPHWRVLWYRVEQSFYFGPRLLTALEAIYTEIITLDYFGPSLDLSQFLTVVVSGFLKCHPIKICASREWLHLENCFWIAWWQDFCERKMLPHAAAAHFHLIHILSHIINNSIWGPICYSEFQLNL